MVIISIVAGVAVMTITTNHHKEYETLTNQLTQAIRLAEQEAMLRPATIGLGLTNQTYEFFIFARTPQKKQKAWQPIQETALKSHKLPNNTHISLKVVGEEAPADGTPQIIITSNNEMTPFTILIGKKDQAPYYQINGNANGEVSSAPFHQE